MGVSLAMPRAQLKNVQSISPFDRLDVYSGQIAGDASGGEMSFQVNLLTTGFARHVYLLRYELSSNDTNLDGDEVALMRSVNPQWNVSPGITTGYSVVNVSAFRSVVGGTAVIGLEQSTRPILPTYLGQVESAGAALIQVFIGSNTNSTMTTCSMLIGLAEEFIERPTNTWPIFS